MTKRILTLIIALAVLVSSMTVPALAAGELELPVYFTELYPDVGTRTPFKPVHQYLYRQNPPTFSWTPVSGAESYDIIVCADEALTDVRYERKGITNNFYLFDTTFEKNVYYWWAVRYNKGTQSSPWSVARRFKIASDATELVFPTKDQILDSIPKGHPRFFFTEETLPQVKEDIMSSPTAKRYLEEKLKNQIIKDMENGVTPEPEIKDYDALKQQGSAASSAYSNGGRSAAQNIGTAAMRGALYYNLTGDTAAADFAVECLMQFSDWEWKNPHAPTSFEVNDLGYYEAITYSAIAYDWLYNYMTQEQREKIAGMIRGRIDAIHDRLMRSLKANPYESHTSSYCGYFGMGIIALLGDQEGTVEMYDEWASVYFANFNPLSIEDGGNGKGINYWLSAYSRDSIVLDALQYAGVFNFYDIPVMRNQYLFGIYQYPKGSNINSWGDGGNVAQGSFYTYIATGASRSAKFTKQPELLWWRNQITGNYYDNLSVYSFDAIFFLDTDDMEDRAPIDYPRDHVFIDQGIAAMHSDLINTPRTSLYFRSGLYGSFNHAQADINSFMIEKSGKELAWKGGYYDTYGSTHHLNFSKATHSHNTITYDDGNGQPINNFDADGKITMFLSHPDMAAAVGDGTDAYVGKLGKYVRTIIYIRPDSYIVVDNLAASDAKKATGGSTFEWWLNSVGTLEVHDDNRGARITNGDAVALDARVQYPEKVTPYYSNLFSNTDLVDFPVDDRKTGAPYHSRVWFQTEKVPETKMIVTMDSRDITQSAEYVKAEQYDNYMELEFEDGTVAYISTATDETTMIDTGEYKFNGTAVVHNDDTLMFIGGTELYIRGQQVVAADRPVAVSMGKDELSVSSDDDYNVTVYANELYMPDPKSVLLRDGRETEMGLGVEAAIDSEAKAVNVKADKGHYYMLLNGKGLPGEKTGETWSYTVVADGKETVCTTDNVYYNADYEPQASALLENNDIVYDTEYKILEATNNMSLGGSKVAVGKRILVPTGAEVVLTGNNQKIVLEAIPSIQTEIETTTDYEAVEKAATVVVQAESATSFEGNTRLTSGIETLGVSQLNLLSDKANYKVEIPESGNYRISVRYAAWQAPYPTRFIDINDIRYYFHCPDTGGYGANATDFDVVTMTNTVYLEAGTHTFTLGANSVGHWNYDWIAFTKAN